MTRVLGVDPSFTSTGWALFEVSPSGSETLLDVGVIKTGKEAKRLGMTVTDDRLRRASEIVAALDTLIGKRNVRAVFAEVPMGTQSAVAATGLGIVTGILSAVHYFRRTVQFQWLTPHQVKKGLTGSARASKEEMQAVALSRYGSLSEMGHWTGSQREHIADAIGAVVAGIDTNVYRSLIGTIYKAEVLEDLS